MLIKHFTLLGLVQTLPFINDGFPLKSYTKLLFSPHKTLSPSYQYIKLVIKVKKKKRFLLLLRLYLIQQYDVPIIFSEMTLSREMPLKTLWL